ncbi:hypothetical protein SDC9_13762 [bioreactor metagenome]|uniref:Uncharacterized protein n=1 Tax=bioreactor metagenome TaxID=1076179 RepID=A0A644TN77_9ZZZZ|nr:hypothetical protein [Negativicutes bacterium]
MSDNTHLEDDDQRKQHALCCDSNEVANIIACLCELKNTIACVLECFDDHSSSTKERIILCILLDEIRRIEAKLDNPLFGLNEIKKEIIDINNIITNSTFGLKEIKNEIIDINNVLTNDFFGLNEIKNEIIEINDLLNNATFGIPELKNEIRVIENRTGRTVRLLTNEVFGLNEIKNEIRGIENQTILLTNNIFGLNEIKAEVREIENRTGRTMRLLTNEVFGLNEIKNEIRGIENQTILLTNDIFGLNEIKSEVRALNHPLTCENDSIRICGCEVGGSVIHDISTDTNSILVQIPQGSAYSQIGRLFSASVFPIFTNSNTQGVLLIVNSPASNRVLYLQRIFGGSSLLPSNQPLRYESSAGILIYTDPTFSIDSSTSVPVINLNAGSSETTAMTVTQNLTSGTVSGNLAGLFIQTNGLFALDFDGQIIIPPGHSLAIDVRNVISTAQDSANILLTAVWYELDA